MRPWLSRTHKFVGAKYHFCQNVFLFTLWVLTSLRVGQKLDEILQFHVSCLETLFKGFRILTVHVWISSLFWEGSGRGYNFSTCLDSKNGKEFLTSCWKNWTLIQIYLLTNGMIFSIVLLVIFFFFFNSESAKMYVAQE